MSRSSKRIYLYRVPREEGLDDRAKGGHIPHTPYTTHSFSPCHIPIRHLLVLYAAYTRFTHRYVTRSILVSPIHYSRFKRIYGAISAFILNDSRHTLTRTS